MKNSGKLLILGILAVALIMAGASWWFRYNATHRTAQFWGAHSAMLIRDAPSVELISLQSADPSQFSYGTETIRIGGTPWRVVGRRSLHQVPGLIHLRTALLEDRSYDWLSQSEAPDVNWRWGLVFFDGRSSPFTIWLSSDCRWAMKEEGAGEPPSTISCKPIASGLTKFIADLPAESTESAR